MFIGMEMVKCLQHKELAFLEKANPYLGDRKKKTIRCCNGFTYDLLQQNLKAFRILKYPYANLYYSLMSFDTMPMFSFAPIQRRQQYREWTGYADEETGERIKGKYAEHYAGYSFGIDIDGDTIADAQADALKVNALYHEYKLPHTHRFSGSRGFHICIETQWLPALPQGKLIPMLAELTTKMKYIDNIPHIDDSITDDRRVFKLPYSFDRGKICLPLTEEQLAGFEVSMVEPQTVLKTCQIKGRGILEQFSDRTPHQAQDAFRRMAANFIDVEVYGHINPPIKIGGLSPDETTRKE